MGDEDPCQLSGGDRRKLKPMKQAFSAPGKALLAGGYLVLDPQYCAYSVALSARIHAVVEWEEELSENSRTTTILCSSPQFVDSEWGYVVDWQQDASVSTPKDISQYGSNPFIESCVRTVAAYASAIFDGTTNPAPGHIKITIYSDDAYHSQDDSTAHSSEKTTGFSYHQLPISKVPKTGLGSSAALSASVTAALYRVLIETKKERTDVDTNKQIIHTLAQVAHCVAQGKIGSGFDVASATFGSVKYRRFPADIIPDSLLKNKDFGPKIVLACVEDERWNTECIHEPARFPSQLRLLMGDVKTGSESPAMASKVLGWRKAQPDRAHEVWSTLDRANMDLISLLDPNDRTNNKDHSTNEGPDITKIRAVVDRIRAQLQIMTVESGADIEPESQSKLLNALYNIPGVVAGLVPGAGGYDAVSVIVLAEEVDNVKNASKRLPECQNVTWLDLHEDVQGLRAEDVERY